MNVYDPRCYDLASIFGADEHLSEEEIQELAQAIQDAIEHWLARP